MLQFIDIYLQTTNPCKLTDIHEIEHRIFLIPELSEIYDETDAITNGMSYSRGIRFSLVTNKKQKCEQFKNFFLNLEKYELPEWTKEEKSRFEAEETEWLIRQRQYFWSFATKCFEEEFDKLNNIKNFEIHKNILKEWFFSGIRICENHKIREVKSFEKQNFIFPKINKTIQWQENGTMFAIILPILQKNYQNFIFFSEWIKIILEKNFVDTGKIYDLDFFNVYECDYILWITHFYSPQSVNQETILKMLKEKPKKSDFEKIRKILLFETEKQKTYFDQEANVVMWFSVNDEKKIIKNASFQYFINNYENFLENLSFVKKEQKKER